MERLTVECLSCGETRNVWRTPWRHVEAGECVRCGYVGWVRTGELSELVRSALRERPLERRWLRSA